MFNSPQFIKGISHLSPRLQFYFTFDIYPQIGFNITFSLLYFIDLQSIRNILSIFVFFDLMLNNLSTSQIH